MKKFLIGFLTLLITIAIIMLGLSMNLKSFVVDSVDTIVKEEIITDISNYVGEITGQEITEVKKGIDKVLNENDTIKNVVNNYFETVIDVMMGKEVTSINIGKDLENVINSSEDILKEYGVTLNESDKKELIDYVSSDEINDTFNETLNEFKGSMPTEFKTAVEIFDFLRSTTFKIILIVVIIVFLGLIALLKKSPYKWLSNLGEASIISGVIMGILMPLVINIIAKELEKSKIILSSKSFSTFGYVAIGIGVIAIILNIVLTKVLIRKENIEAKN